MEDDTQDAGSQHDRRVAVILQNPVFHVLVHKKRQLSWTLAILLLVIYFGFITLVAIAPDFMHQTFSGSVITYGIPLGIGVILFAFVLCGVYVWRANGEFDRLTQAVVHDSRHTSSKEPQ